MECVKCSHFLPSGQALQSLELRRQQTPWHHSSVDGWSGLPHPRPTDTLQPQTRARSAGQPLHRSPSGLPGALHRAANDRQGMENAPQRRRDSGNARRGAAAERPEDRGGRRETPRLRLGTRGLGRTSLSGTHCGSSKPNGLPKARCSGTMRRPLGERTSFLASRRAATPEDMSPPEPLTPPPALSPHRAPPRPAHQHDDSPKAQSAATARNISQSESSTRPRAALLQSAQGPRPYDRPPIGGEDRGGTLAPLGRL